MWWDRWNLLDFWVVSKVFFDLLKSAKFDIQVLHIFKIVRVSTFYFNVCMYVHPSIEGLPFCVCYNILPGNMFSYY